MKKLIKIQLTLAVPLIIAGGFFAYFIFYSVTGELNNETLIINDQTEEEIFYKAIDGTKTDQESQNLLPLAIMIENHIDARPQSGLVEAGIVYEILTEASITRFLAIYDLTEELDQIGPVRSARPYFIDLASEYGAIYAHSGGSPTALKRLKSDSGVFNLDEFFGYNSGYFFRSNNRYAPHNLYTSSELLLEAKINYQLQDNSDFSAWKFKDGAGSGSEIAEITINYSETSLYQVVWKYLTTENKYERWQNNSRHIDNKGNIIEVDNVIIQYANTRVIDTVGRKKIDLIGEGRAIIFRDGIIIKGNWRKKSASDRTTFYDTADNEIELNRGKVWIQIVPVDMEIGY